MCSVNSHLTMRQENERLKGIMARIESYDVVVSIFPFRHFFAESANECAVQGSIY